MAIPERDWRGVIRRTPQGAEVFLLARHATAELYGWTVAFDPKRPEVAPPVPPNGRKRVALTPKLLARGGRRLWISRAETKEGKAKGKVNAFRIARAATNKDIALVAAATKVEWHWLTDKRGARVDRELWLKQRLLG